MAELTKRDAKLVQYLNRAYGTERRLETTLEAHLAMTTRKDYERRLQAHLKETRAHASAVERRIRQLGGEAETVSVPGPDSLARGAQAAQSTVQRAAAAVQAPIHALRGTGEQERMLTNALAEFQDEAEEIATYRLLDALATSVGDKETARLAKKALREEERMAAFLGDLIPKLAVDVAHDEIPVAEIEGPAAHRTARDGASTSRRTTRSGANATRSSASKSTGTKSRAAKSTAAKSTAAKSSGTKARATKSTAAKSSGAKSRAAKSSATKSSGTRSRAATSRQTKRTGRSSGSSRSRS
jgi:ferritin-like metal-binding protein YciE